MEKSKFENIGNTQLFFTLKFIVENTSSSRFDYSDIEYSSFRSDCDNASSIVGITGLDFIDYNYLLAVLLLNKNFDYTTKKPEGTLVRPSVGLYSFDIDEHRNEYVRRTYKHEVESYLPELIQPMIRGMEDEGVFEYYEGQETDTDYYDGETTDVNFDRSSVRKIK
jgi:hypothetical protein